MLALLDMFGAIEAGHKLDPKASRRKVLGIDIDTAPTIALLIEAHLMASRIQMIQGSSIAPAIIEQVRAVAANYSHVLVCLDSNQTHDHVLAELQAYATLTSKGSYCDVFDTIIEDMPKEMFPDRPWGPGKQSQNSCLGIPQDTHRVRDRSAEVADYCGVRCVFEKGSITSP